MKKTNKLLFQLLLVFLIFITESCERKNESTTIKNAFEIFNNQTLVIDSTTSNHLKFVKQQDSVLILKKDSILYAFDIEKINAVFSNDVYVFYDINKEGFSELKLKKFHESEELKNKKEYLSHKKNAIENTIVFIEQDFNCADKYQLDVGSFDLTNTIKNNYIQYNVADFKFKPINEDVALFVEDNCKNISIKVLAILTIDSTKGNIIFKPIKIELFNKNNNSKIDGVGILQNNTENLIFLNTIEKRNPSKIDNKKENTNKVVTFYYLKAEMVQLKGKQVVGKKKTNFKGKIEFYKNEIKIFNNNVFERHEIISVIKYENIYQIRTKNNKGDRCVIAITIEDNNKLVTFHYIDMEMMMMFYITKGFTLDIDFYNS